MLPRVRFGWAFGIGVIGGMTPATTPYDDSYQMMNGVVGASLVTPIVYFAPLMRQLGC